MQITFDLGEPFQPYNQLMGVFPAGSKHALPAPLQPLFDDPNSPILDFYPKDFKVDMNGKRFAWQGVALLPFIDEARLLEATQPIIDALPDSERRRNERCCFAICSPIRI
jgi:5'-3' exoribonuclease 2